jgi:hypothetical protein
MGLVPSLLRTNSLLFPTRRAPPTKKKERIARAVLHPLSVTGILATMTLLNALRMFSLANIAHVCCINLERDSTVPS